MTETPLGRPIGTVRAYIAIAIVAVFLAGHLTGAIWLLTQGDVGSALALLGAVGLEAGTVTGFYFGARSAQRAA